MTEAIIHSVFPTLIYYNILTNFKSLNEELELKALNIKRQVGELKTDWLCSTFNTLNSVDIKHDEHFSKIINFTCDEVTKFSYNYGIFNKKIICKDAWVNVSINGDYQEYHNHPSNHFSAVYYIKTPENSGDLHLKNSESFFDMCPLPVSREVENINSTQTVKIEPTESLLLIFRSNLNHMVTQNLSNDHRISLAMNFLYS